MSYLWSRDSRMLAAGNARTLKGGDSDRMPVSPTAGAVTGSGPDFTATRAPLALLVGPLGMALARAVVRAAAVRRAGLERVTPDDLNGDLTANARRLGVYPADLVRLRLARKG
jgi:hypothetical protein